MASSVQAALHTRVTKNNLELFKNSEFENIRGLFGITRMMIEGNSEMKNVLFGGKPIRTISVFLFFSRFEFDVRRCGNIFF